MRTAEEDAFKKLGNLHKNFNIQQIFITEEEKDFVVNEVKEVTD